MPTPPTAREALDAVGMDAIEARIADAESLSQIARSLGISRAALRDWLDADPSRSARARVAVEASAEAEDDLAVEAIEALTTDATPGQIAKARELAQHRRWRAKIRNPRAYGDKLQVEHALPSDVPALLAELRGLMGINQGDAE